MKLLDEYFDMQKKIYEYFGYREDWASISIKDSRAFFWNITGEGPDQVVRFAREEKYLFEGTMSDGYSTNIDALSFFPRWVFRAKKYTMICVDTHQDGNKFLQIFDNAKER